MRKRNTMTGFQKIMGRRPGKIGRVTKPISTYRKPLDPGALYHFWHPDREGVEAAPADVQQRLLEIGGTDFYGKPKLMCVKPPAGAPIRCRCWLVFYRKPEITYWLSPGWLLVLAWHDRREPIPRPLAIDDRLYANLYLQSVKGGREIYGRDFDNARKYYDHVVMVMERDKARYERERQQYQDDRSHDYWDATKIRNIGHGSKFALHHDGTVFPSRNEANWLLERGRFLPKEVVDRDNDETAIRGRKGTVTTQVDQNAVRRSQSDRILAELKVKQQIRNLLQERRREQVFVNRGNR